MELAIGTLATYAVTLMLTSATGPFGVFARLRTNEYLGALKCFTCTSVWVGALVALYFAADFGTWVMLALAVSGGATALDRLTMGRL